jgi:hypothetical protein
MLSLTSRVAAVAVLSLAVSNVPRSQAQFIPRMMGPGFMSSPSLYVSPYVVSMSSPGYSLMISPYMISGSSPGSAFTYSQPLITYSYRSPSGGSISGYGYYGGYGYGGGYGGYGGGYASAPYGNGSITSYYVDDYSKRSRNQYRSGYYQADNGGKNGESYQDQNPAARRNPTITEILSAGPLNELLADLRQQGAKAEKLDLGPLPIPLDEAGQKHINVTHGAGNIALIKNEGNFKWPAALSGSEFKKARAEVEALIAESIKQAKSKGVVDGATVKQLEANIDTLKKELKRTGADLAPSEYIEANVFFNNFYDAVKALRLPDVGNYFTGVYAPKVKTLPELVKFMTAQRLEFAKAMPGDENAYVKLYRALDEYDQAVTTQAAQK